KLVGITGTNGKTTTTNIIKHILTENGNKVGLMGTIQNEIDDIVLPAKHTTPDAYALASMQDKMVRAGCKYAVMEVSSHALDQHRLASCFFEAGAFTNLTQDHLDYHKTMENYFEAKKKLFNMSKHSVINIDDEYGQKIANDLGSDAITFSVKDKTADFFADNIVIKADGSHFDLVAKGERHKIDFCMPGYFSVANALTAAAVCNSLGIEIEKVAKSLNSSKGVTGRTEVIKANTEFSIIRDYAHSPDGLLKIISSVREFSDGNRIVVLFGCAGNRDRTKRKTMAEIVARLSDFCILTSDNPRDEDEMQIINDAKIGFAQHETPYMIIPDRFEAIKWAIENCKKDDILILAGKGHEDYQVLDYGTIYFDEKEIVQRLTGYKQ
ncbi:MAG: UDP-N-acetylmuramoyl-L-alanyl-D-glutamate--2,6-diaminopimelate ligase, partial [Oscillospiraceae bacterium]